MDSLLTLSATTLARLIKSGQVTSREAVEVHIARILAVNPAINALVVPRFEAARAEADAADALRQRVAPEELPPLHGVPCTIKESMALTGMPHSAGLVARQHIRASKDATTVARLRQAGAIPLGVTNISELCMWMESDNRVYGRTNNAYHRDRIAGGSSGGEGAIVGAGGVPFGLGSDIGGSIRMPAFFNGIFGHKPTGGMVPSTGMYPPVENDARRYNTPGPLTRRAEDLMPLLRILAGPDGPNDGCRDFALGDPTSVAISALSVVSIEDNAWIPVHLDLRQAQRDVASHLASRGARVRTTRVEALKESLFVWSSMLSEASDTSFRALLGNGRRVRVGRELVRLALGRSQHTLPALGLALLERIPEAMPHGSRRYVESGRALRLELEREIGPDGVMLFPSYSRPAPRHGRPLWPPYQWVYTAIINVLELPATQVPLGFDAEGVPVGVQVIAMPGNDHLTIAVALELERAFGGWVAPEHVRQTVR